VSIYWICSRKSTSRKILWELVNNRIVGGINRKSTEKIRALYKIFVNGKIYLTTAADAKQV